MDELELYEKKPKPGLPIKKLLLLIGDYNMAGGDHIIEKHDVIDVIEAELSAYNDVNT